MCCRHPDIDIRFIYFVIFHVLFHFVCTHWGERTKSWWLKITLATHNPSGDIFSKKTQEIQQTYNFLIINVFRMNSSPFNCLDLLSRFPRPVSTSRNWTHSASRNVDKKVIFVRHGAEQYAGDLECVWMELVWSVALFFHLFVSFQVIFSFVSIVERLWKVELSICLLAGCFFPAEILLRSPRNLFIYIILKNDF